MDNAKPQQTRAIYRFNDFRLDASERRLWLRDDPIPLKPKQFDLLLYFVENAGRTTKKDELLEAVWQGTYVEESTLARNVSWLRTLLEDGSDGRRIIETVSKIGYRFTADVSRTGPDENLLIVEEQAVQHFRGEETITFDGAELAKINGTRSARSFAFYAVLFVPVVFVLVIGSGFVLYRQSWQTSTADALTEANKLNVKATITVKNISVDATRESVDVGLKIQPGDVIKVTAMGVHQPEPGQTWTFQGDAKGEISSEHTFQSADPWSLVAWIGNETDKSGHFQASTNPAFQAKKSGELYLAVNDLIDKYADNRGGLNVAVILYRQYNIYAEDDNPEMAWGKELVKIHKTDVVEIRSRGNVAYWKNGELYDLDGSDHSTTDHLAPEINARSLIGRIGNNPAFKAGKDFPKQQVSVGGWLFLSVNDRILNWAGSYKNNSGEITTDIEVGRLPEEFKQPI